MKSEEIIRCMIEKYAACLSYKDKGYLRNYLEGDDIPERPYLTFSTLYKVPFFFRFQWQDHLSENSPWREHIVGCDGQTAYSKYEDSELITQSSLKYAIAEANATSRNAVAQISQHLPEIDLLPISWLKRHKNLTWIGTEAANGRECFCIASSVKNAQDSMLWIACDDFSLRRVKTYTLVTADVANHVADMAKKLGVEDAVGSALPREKQRAYIETNYEETIFNQELKIEDFAMPPA
jgi:hypothetical protein